MEEEKEEWRPVVGCEGLYEVSNLGRVRTVAKTYVDRNNVTHTKESHLVKSHDKFSKKPNGRPAYQLIHLPVNGKIIHTSVHRLVAKAFVPNDKPEIRDQVNHKNGIKNDNRASNLEWCTGEENKLHARKLGLMRPNPPKGEKAVFAKLSAKDVASARELYDDGTFTSKELARDFGVTQCTMLNAIRGRSYHDADEIRSPCELQEHKTGAKSPCAAFTKQDIVDIKARLAKGETQTSIAKSYGVSLSTVWRVANNLRYTEDSESNK